MAGKLAGSAAQNLPAGLLEFQTRRKEGTRNRLLAAAAARFSERGYLPVSIDEIALDAGVSRMTFYRHFSGKAEIATQLFRANANAHLPVIIAIGHRDFRDPSTVRDWIRGIFSVDRKQRAILQAFIQANVIEPGFAEEGHAFIEDIIAALGAEIPAFALTADTPNLRRRCVEASLLIYEILDQSNHAARNLGVAADFLIVEILADRFVTFVTM